MTSVSQDGGKEKNITVVIDLLSDSDNDDDENNVDVVLADNQVVSANCTDSDDVVITNTTVSVSDESQIQVFQSILPHMNRNTTIQYLTLTQWNVEDAIHMALSSTNFTTTTTTSNTAKEEEDNDDQYCHHSTSIKCMKRPRSNETANDNNNNNNNNNENENDDTLLTILDTTFNTITTSSSSSTNEEHFMDSDFPPTGQSIDGRFHHHTTTTTTTVVVTKCHCGCIATPKQVQSDGPNYGKYYLTCGWQKPLRQRKTQPPSPDPALPQSLTELVSSCNTHDTTSETTNTSTTSTGSTRSCTSNHLVEVPPDDLQQQQQQQLPSNISTTTTAVLRNPYLHKKATKSHPLSTTSIVKNSNTLIIPNRNPCTFFQWDTTGVLGTVNRQSIYDTATSSSNDGYQMNRRTSIRNHISWYRFSIEQRCTLYPRTSSSVSTSLTYQQHPRNINDKKVNVSHIQQGMVGDCWFLSALTVVAEQSYLIERILPPSSEQQVPRGQYILHLFIDGMWQPIVIDSYLPVVYKPLYPPSTKERRHNVRNGIPVQISKPILSASSSNQPETNHSPTTTTTTFLAVPVFCATPDRILWPALIEKAYAKAHGSYQQLSGGFIAEGLHDLTGAPCETYLLQEDTNLDREMFWMKLLSFHSAGFVMGVATSNGGDGLVGGHAYSILDVCHVPDAMIGEQSKVTDYFSTTKVISDSVAIPKQDHDIINVEGTKSISNDRTSIRLVRIRNPWGKREWKGDWSVDSEQWTRALRKRVGTDTAFAKGDGTFYMSYDDMLQRFHHLDVAKTQKGWIHTSVDGMFVQGADPLLSSKSIYQISVTKTTQAYLSIIQPKKRSNTKSQYWYCDPSMMLLRKVKDADAEQWEYVACTLNGVTRQCHLEVFLEANQMYICVPWSCAVASDHRFRFVTYSGSAVQVKSLSDTESDKNDDAVIIPSIRECTLRNLFSELILCNDGRHIHPIIAVNGMNGLLIGTYSGTQSSLYLLAVNGSPEHYLSVRMNGDNLREGHFVCTIMGQNRKVASMTYQDFDIPPMSQQILLVVTHNGTRSRKEKQNHPSFRYVSTWVKASSNHFTTKKPVILESFGTTMKVCPAGRNALSLHCSPGRNSFERDECRGTIQTFFEYTSMLLGQVSGVK